MGSDNIPGAILLLPHQTNSLEELKAKAKQGLVEEGVMLQLDGEVQTFGSTGIQANYQGVINFQPDRAFAVSLINPHASGLTIVAMTNAAQFSAEHRELVKAVGQSVVFEKVAAPVVS